MVLELFPSILKQIQEKNGVGKPISINPLAVGTKNRSSLIEQTTPVALALSDTIAIASWRKAERSKVDFGGKGFLLTLPSLKLT